MNAPVEREEIYFRHVNYVGYRRTDDLWDIEGRFLDRRAVDCPCVDRGGMVRAGETFHEMTLCLTVDDDLFVRDLRVGIDKYPYRQCPLAQAVFKNAVGLQIAPALPKNCAAAFPSNRGAPTCFPCCWGRRGRLFRPSRRCV